MESNQAARRSGVREGKYLAFLASEGEKGKSQIWLLDRRGGAPQALTSVKQDINDYKWSPDGKRILLRSGSQGDDTDANKKDGDTARAPKPIVLDRYRFQYDVDGYISAASRTHLYLFGVDNKKLEALTSDPNFEESASEWSPDGKQIAFVSNHEKDPDQSPNDEIYLVDARAGAAPRKISSGYSASGQKLSWSPDGKLIAYLVGYEAKYNAYNMDRLALLTVADGTSRLLTEKFDRGIGSPEFTADGSALCSSFPMTGQSIQRKSR